MKKNKIVVVVFVGLVGLVMCGAVAAEDAESLLGQGDGFFDKHYYEQAKEVYQVIIADYPGSTHAQQAQEKMVIMDLASRLNEADRLNDECHLEQAEVIYQSMINDYPSSDYALLARRKLINVYIVNGKDAEADALFGRMVVDCAGNEQLPKAVYTIGDRCRGQERYDKAKYYYNYVIGHWAGSDIALLAQKDLVKVSIEDSYPSDAQQKLEEFKSKFAGDTRLPEALCSIAESYAEKKMYSRANELNQYIVSNWPGSKQGLQAQENRVRNYIEEGDNWNAQKALDDLLANFKSQDGYAQAIADIVYYGYSRAGNYGKAVELYQYLVDTCPGDPGRIYFRQGLAIANIWYRDEPDDPNTEKAIADFEAEFGGHNGYAVSAFQIGEAYYDKGRKLAEVELSVRARDNLLQAIIMLSRVVSEPFFVGITERAYFTMGNCYLLMDEYDKAIENYRQTAAVATDWPDSKKYAIEAQERLAIASVSKGDDAEVQKKIEELAVKYKDSEFLPPMIFHIAEEYWFKAEKKRKARDTEGAKELYERSLAIFDFIIKELEPERERLGSTYTFRAACYYRLGQLEKSIEDYQMMADYWPGHRWAATAQCMVAECYRELLEVRIWAMDDDGAEAAEAGMEKAYKATIENYPEKSVSLHACKQMGQHCYEQERWAEAIEYFEGWYQRQSEAEYVLDMLELCYEEMEKSK